MKVWITGYIGSGKTYVAKNLRNVFEFDYIEELLLKKGYNLKELSKKKFKTIVKNELNNLNNIILEGIQCCDYYQKGDKVCFIKTNFLISTINSIKRDGLKKAITNLWDNIILFFRLKNLYMRVLKNNDIITNIKEINKYIN